MAQRRRGGAKVAAVISGDLDALEELDRKGLQMVAKHLKLRANQTTDDLRSSVVEAFRSPVANKVGTRRHEARRGWWCWWCWYGGPWQWCLR
jgi:hypothetical protein